MQKFLASGFLVVLLAGWLHLPPGWCAGAALPAMEKYVSPQGNYVLYKPQGWLVKESGQVNAWMILVSDPGGNLVASKGGGVSPAGQDLVALVRTASQPFKAQAADFRYEKIWLAKDGSRVVYDYFYTHPAKGQRQGKCWLALRDGKYSLTLCETPVKEFAEKKALLLSVLANLRLLKGAFLPVSDSQAPTLLPLKTCRLGDGSASFAIPRDWTFKDLRNTQFVALDPAGSASFLVTNVEVLNPKLRVSVPNFPVSAYLHPDRAWVFLTSWQRLASNMQFLERLPRADLNQQISRVYTGPVSAAELLYTFTSATGKASKGYTFGISFGSRLETDWRFWHMTVTALKSQFDACVPTFVAMLQSYKISDQFAQNYIAQGIQRLKQLQQQTAALAARNAREIPAMMQAAYDERQRSMDYIDYQRTKYIRGEQDWISHMEGGTIYHTDSWGTRNNYTGETWSGAPFDYLHFEGDNPKYRESMTPVDSRRLYDQVFGK
jgi:hypothetical protein